MTKSRKLAYLALLGNTVLWGLAIPIVKRGFQDGLTPTTFLLGRYFLAAAASIPYMLVLSRRQSLRKVLKRKTLGTILILEAVGTVLALWLLYEGVARTTAIEASLIAITWPIFVTIGGVAILKERVERHELTGLVLALIGTAVLIITPLLSTEIGRNFSGNILILGQNMAIATYYLAAKRFYQGLNKWAVTHISFWVGILGFSAILAFSGQSPIEALTSIIHAPSLWPALATAYMALGGSILGLTLYLIGQDKIEASEAAVFTYLQPIIAIPASFLLLQERISLIEIIGAAIIAVGVYVAERRRGKTRPGT